MKLRQKMMVILMKKKDKNKNINNSEENPSIKFEEAVKRLLATPPKKKIKTPKKDK